MLHIDDETEVRRRRSRRHGSPAGGGEASGDVDAAGGASEHFLRQREVRVRSACACTCARCVCACVCVCQETRKSFTCKDSRLKLLCLSSHRDSCLKLERQGKLKEGFSSNLADALDVLADSSEEIVVRLPGG